LNENGRAASTLAHEVRELIEKEKLTEKEALKRAARARGMGKSEAYREFQRGRGK
jgi:16S rRNA (cytidine1402-2'-O)-methyltransferase